MARLRRSNAGAGGKPTGPQRGNARGAGWARPESWVRDPKPVDLGLGRLKPWETTVEDRTRVEVQITGITWA